MWLKKQLLETKKVQWNSSKQQVAAVRSCWESVLAAQAKEVVIGLEWPPFSLVGVNFPYVRQVGPTCGLALLCMCQEWSRKAESDPSALLLISPSDEPFERTEESKSDREVASAGREKKTAGTALTEMLEIPVQLPLSRGDETNGHQSLLQFAVMKGYSKEGEIFNIEHLRWILSAQK